VVIFLFPQLPGYRPFFSVDTQQRLGPENEKARASVIKTAHKTPILFLVCQHPVSSGA
jgi:hypothetical protein